MTLLVQMYLTIQHRQQWIQLDLFTPVKEVKGLPKCLKQRDFAANNLFSASVSKVANRLRRFSID